MNRADSRGFKAPDGHYPYPWETETNFMERLYRIHG